MKLILWVGIHSLDRKVQLGESLMASYQRTQGRDNKDQLNDPR